MGLKEGDVVSCSKMVLRYMKPDGQDSVSSDRGGDDYDEEQTTL